MDIADNREVNLSEPRIIELRQKTKPDLTRPHGDTIAFARAIESETTSNVLNAIRSELDTLLATYATAASNLETALKNLQEIETTLRQREPFYAMRRKGLHYWCTITKEQYLELKSSSLFDTRIFYDS